MSPRSKPPGGERGPSLEVEWTTISYRTLAVYVVLVLLLVLGTVYLMAPRFFMNTATRLLESVAANPTAPQAPASRKEAHFSADLDGTVTHQEGAFVAVDAG